MSDWKKVKIGDVCEIIKGATGIASAEPGEYPLVVTAVERKTCSSFQFDCEAVCIPLVSSSGHGKKSLNNVHYQKGKFALGTILCAVVPNNPNELDARFLHQYLQFYKDKILVPLMKGAANVSLSMKDIAKVEIPLPSIEKQHELSELFVEAQKKYKELLEESEKQKSYAKQLRQNILQEAIEGKLTEEWRKENPVVKGNPDFDAEALFEQIQKEKYHTDLFAPNGAHAKKAKSVSSEPIRVTRKEKSLPPITEDEIPFEIPAGWKWVRLGEICEKITDGTHKTPKYTNSGVKFVSAKDIYNKELDFSHCKYISENEHRELYKRCNPEYNDLLISKSGSIGTVALNNVKYEFSLFESLALVKYNQKLMLPKFMQYAVQYICNNLTASDIKGVCVKHLHLNVLSSQILSVPPLAEQKEIVSRVEKLLANVAELENQITEREEMTKQLMQSIMKDAFREE